MSIKVTKFAFALLIVFGGLCTTLAFFGQFDWRLDLLSHFRLQYLLYFLILLVFAVVLKSKVFISSTLILLIINLLPFLPMYVPVKSPSKESGLVVLSANVQRGNREYIKTLQLIEKVKPDIIVLEEVDNGWIAPLSSLKTAYPYQISEPRDDFFGLELLSKYPLQHQRIKKLGATDVPTVMSEIQVQGKILTVIGIHPIPPFTRYNTVVRNDQIENISQFVNSRKTPVLLVGDMNTTAFSYPYKKFIHDTNLTDCSDGFGYHPTWYLRPFLPPLGLRIDHCFYTKPLVILDSYVGGEIGSDHRPIIIRFSL